MTATTSPRSHGGSPRGDSPRSGVARRRRGAQTPGLSFRFRAVDHHGAVQEGELVASSDADAVARLRRLGLRPVSVRRSRSSVLQRNLSVPGMGPRVKGTELAVLARQFATMVNAGVPLLRTLEVLRRQSENPLLRATLDQMRLDVESGDSLSEAIARHPKVFDHLFVSMVRSGEAAGALDVVLAQLAATLERTVAIRQKVRSALAYPIAVSFMVAGVIAAMLVFVVPTFAGIYDDLGGSLPLPTQLLVAASEAVTSNLAIAGLVLTALVIAGRRWTASPSGRHRWDGMKLRLPLVGSLLRKSVMARFGRTMAVLTRSGVPVLETLRITGETVGNAQVAEALERTRDAVRRGEPIAQNLANSHHFPAMVVQLVAVGEETGALDQMFEIVGESFEDEVETAVAGFSALIEPLMMAVIGLVVGAMVVALYLPMFRVIDLVQ